MRKSLAILNVSLVALPAALAVLQGGAARGAALLAVDVNPTAQVTSSNSVSQPPGMYWGHDENILSTNGMYGWTFVLTGAATVTGVAWYAENTNGLLHAHEIGLWQYAAGSTNMVFGYTNAPLLFSVVVPAGTNAALLDGVWRDVDLPAPLSLPVGSYVLAGTWYSLEPDPVKYVALLGNRSALDPRVLVGEPAYRTGSPWAPIDPSAPFGMPDEISVDPLRYGLELGPNLLLLPPVPSLGASEAGGRLVLTWPAWATNYVLETSGALGAGASWTAATNAVGLSGGGFLAANAITGASAFYRLRGQ
jgi:hypothetical protein